MLAILVASAFAAASGSAPLYAQTLEPALEPALVDDLDGVAPEDGQDGEGVDDAGADRTAGAADNAPAEASPKRPRQETRAILAVSWQNAACEARPGTPECRQPAAGAGQSGFALHGLWVPGLSACPGTPWALRRSDRSVTLPKWSDLPAVDLTPALAGELAARMPAARSGFDRYQWQRFGQCSGLSAEAYFRHALDLLAAINGSGLAALFADRAGKTVTEADIAAVIEGRFGAAASGTVKMRCRRDGDRMIVTGLTFGLSASPANLGTAADLGALMASAAKVPIGCRSGIVDPPGAQ